MNKINAFRKKVDTYIKKAGVTIARTLKKYHEVIVSNKVKSSIIGSVTAVTIIGIIVTIAVVNNNHEHVPLAAISENYVAPTCELKGSYEEVIYCADCEEELERNVVTINACTTIVQICHMIHRTITASYGILTKTLGARESQLLSIQ